MCAGVQVVHEQVEEAERDVGPRVLQSEQRPGNLLPGHHIRLYHRIFWPIRVRQAVIRTFRIFYCSS